MVPVLFQKTKRKNIESEHRKMNERTTLPDSQMLFMTNGNNHNNNNNNDNNVDDIINGQRGHRYRSPGITGHRSSLG